MNKAYDIDTIISAEEFRKNQERTLARDMIIRKKLKLRKWVKIAIAFIVAFILVGLYTLAINNFSEQARKCDEAKGHICTIYEIQSMRGSYE